MARAVAMTRNIKSEAEAWDGKRRYRFALTEDLTSVPQTYGSSKMTQLVIEWINDDDPGGALILTGDAVDALREILS